jgi:hypothetical protein
VVDGRADHDPRAAPALDGGGQAEDAEGVGLGAAAGQHDLLAGPAHQRGDLAPGDLDEVPGRPPLCVDRGGISHICEGGGHGRPRGRDQRRRGVEVQVDSRVC